MNPGQTQPTMPQQPMMQPATQPTPQPVAQNAQPQMILPNQVQPTNPYSASLGNVAMAANQANPTPPNQDNPTSTQSTLLISEIRDNMIIMKDGSFRAVVTCKSINFDLMSDAEREAVEYSYQNFLNSLKEDIQILIRSQRIDIAPYIEKLAEIRRNNDNMLLGVLMDDYIDFISALSREANIMDKSFFIIVPYYTSKETKKAIAQTKTFFESFQKPKAPPITRIDRATYEKAIEELANSTDSIIAGLGQMNIQAVRLDTKQLGELFYNFNNPDTAIREPLVDFANLATMYVKKGEKQNG